MSEEVIFETKDKTFMLTDKRVVQVVGDEKSSIAIKNIAGVSHKRTVHHKWVLIAVLGFAIFASLSLAYKIEELFNVGIACGILFMVIYILTVQKELKIYSTGGLIISQNAKGIDKEKTTTLMNQIDELITK